MKDHSPPRHTASLLPAGYRPRQCARVWLAEPPDWRDRLDRAVASGSGNLQSAVFFRADDVGAGGQAFEALCRVFREQQVPLAMAVVPAWLSHSRLQHLFQNAPLDEPLWGWHQHGWRHVNWQKEGKRSEFGEQRPFERQWRDIWQGRQKMQEIFGEHFLPIFTPPWNRLCNSTLRILHELDFRGVSMTGPLPRGAKNPGGIKNLRIQIDLHTRKAQDPDADFDNLLEEIRALGSRKEPTGIMIHHQRMTPFALEFLQALLSVLRDRARTRFWSFRTILSENHAA